MIPFRVCTSRSAAFFRFAGGLVFQHRTKMTKTQPYERPHNAFPTGVKFRQKNRIGTLLLSSEYVQSGTMLARQRKYVSKNPFVTRKKHFKTYPGVNVSVAKDTSLHATTHGRVKYTHDLSRDVMMVNVIPEPQDELQQGELWRYRTEHVLNKIHNRLICQLRQKANISCDSLELVNPPMAPSPPAKSVTRKPEQVNNWLIRDPLSVVPLPFALRGQLLRKHLMNCHARLSNQVVPFPDVIVNDPLVDTILLTNNNNLQYFGDMKIGDDVFRVIPDTGSDKAWVPGHACKSCPSQMRHLTSAPATKSHGSELFRYGTGKVECEYHPANVGLNGGPTSENEQVCLATKMTDRPFSKLPLDGIVGLPNSKDGLLYKLLKDFDEKVMGVYLSNDSRVPGTLTLGRLDEAHIEGDAIGEHKTMDFERLGPRVVKVGSGNWNIPMIDVEVDGKRLHLCDDDKSNVCDALVDTGSSLITGPPREMNTLLSAIKAKSGDHSQSAGSRMPFESEQAPRVSLVFGTADGGEVKYPLAEKDYMIDFKDTGERKIGFGALDLGQKKWVIGNTFLRRYYTKFDLDKSSVSFYKSHHDNDNGVVTASMPSREMFIGSTSGHTWTSFL